nr:secoisolariciresinol dehydrogenase-like [Ipomoea trifida]
MFSNAGVVEKGGEVSILDSNYDNLRNVFDANVLGAFLCAKHAARVMIPARKGSVVFTSSVASVTHGDVPHEDERCMDKFLTLLYVYGSLSSALSSLAFALATQITPVHRRSGSRRHSTAPPLSAVPHIVRDREKGKREKEIRNFDFDPHIVRTLSLIPKSKSAVPHIVPDPQIKVKIPYFPFSFLPIPDNVRNCGQRWSRGVTTRARAAVD